MIGINQFRLSSAQSRVAQPRRQIPYAKYLDLTLLVGVHADRARFVGQHKAAVNAAGTALFIT
jgi:hypothetical protein